MFDVITRTEQRQSKPLNNRCVCYLHNWRIKQQPCYRDTAMDFLIFSLCLYLVWSTYRLHHSFAKRRSSSLLLPGPPRRLIIGNLLSLGCLPHRSLHELSPAHGPIIKLSIGQIATVVISFPSLVREVLQTQDSCFSNRFVPDTLTAHLHGQYGISFMPISPLFHTLRKIYNTHILATKKLDSNRHLRVEQVQRLIRDVTRCAEEGHAVDVGEAAIRTVLNLLSNTAFSVDLTDYHNSVSRELKELVTNISIEAGRPNIADYFPVLKRWDPQGWKRRIEGHFGRLLDMFEGMIQKRMEMRAGRGRCRRDDLLETLLDLSKDKSQGIKVAPNQTLVSGKVH